MRTIIKKLYANIENQAQSEKMPLTIAIGVFFGLMPFPGLSTIACAASAYFMRLNLVAIQAINYALYPVQLILLIPFIKTGELAFSNLLFNNYTPLTWETMHLDFFSMISEFWQALIMANLLYICCILPLLFLIDQIMKKKVSIESPITSNIESAL